MIIITSINFFTSLFLPYLILFEWLLSIPFHKFLFKILILLSLHHTLSIFQKEFFLILPFQDSFSFIVVLCFVWWFLEKLFTMIFIAIVLFHGTFCLFLWYSFPCRFFSSVSLMNFNADPFLMFLVSRLSLIQSFFCLIFLDLFRNILYTFYFAFYFFNCNSSVITLSFLFLSCYLEICTIIWSNSQFLCFKRRLFHFYRK